MKFIAKENLVFCCLDQGRIESDLSISAGWRSSVADNSTDFKTILIRMNSGLQFPRVQNLVGQLVQARWKVLSRSKAIDHPI